MTIFQYSELNQCVMATRTDSKSGIITCCMVSPEMLAVNPNIVMQIIDRLDFTPTPKETRKAEDFFNSIPE